MNVNIKKSNFRQRAHSNPFSFHDIDYPINPNQVDWSVYFPNSFQDPKILDVGSGYGDFLFVLGKLFPSTNILGFEIRNKVFKYFQEKLKFLRKQSPDNFSNIYLLRVNAMKYISRFIKKGQLEKIYFLFPDPHFKTKKFKARIITPILLSEYAYFLCDGARVYIATDVYETYNWMVESFLSHPLFASIPPDILKNDQTVSLMITETNEAKKVIRNNGKIYYSVFEKVKG